MTIQATAAWPGPSADVRGRYAQLSRINYQDLIDNFGLTHVPRLHPLVRQVFGGQIERFTRMVMRFDDQIGAAGLQAAAREMMATYTQGVRVAGVENVPAEGPVLFTANHAGMTESLACFSAIPRADLKVVGNDRPFARALPNMFARMIAVPEHAGDRFAVVRQITRHLQAGKALFINPAGKIEPDPACMPGAIESLATWSPSLSAFVKHVPAVRVVPTLVSSVILPSTLSHPLAQLRRTQKDRERTAAAIQLIEHMRLRERTPVTPAVRFGEPLEGVRLAMLGDSTDILEGVLDAMAALMRSAGFAGV